MHLSFQGNDFHNEGSRVGVVGSTRNGKRKIAFVSALFRPVDPGSGKVLIDRLGIIPQ